jgi:hypothetical protein
MTKFDSIYARLSEDNKYVLDERVAIKMDSGIEEEEAKEQAVNEYLQERNQGK